MNLGDEVDMNTPPYIKQIAGGKSAAHAGAQLCAVLLGVMGWSMKGRQEGGGVCLHIADSCRCTSEMST